MAITFRDVFLPDANKTAGFLGITDPDKGTRSLREMQRGQESANKSLDDDTFSQFKMLEDAGVGRDLGQNLDAYDTSMNNAQSLTSKAGELIADQAGAGSAEQVQENLNPQMQQMLANTMQQVQGSAGSALQSSAATRTGAQAVSNQAGDLWQQAFQNTMNRAQNNLQVGQGIGQTGAQTANLAGQRLTADNQPMEDWLNLKNNVAMQRYAGNVGLTQAAGQAAGTDQSLLGGLLGG